MPEESLEDQGTQDSKAFMKTKSEREFATASTATRSWTTHSHLRPPRTKTLTVAAKDRETYVAVRVRAELTQGDPSRAGSKQHQWSLSAQRLDVPMDEHPELRSARDRSDAANPQARASLTLKEEPSNSMVDFVMHAETRWQRS